MADSFKDSGRVSASANDAPPQEAAVLRKVTMRLIPFLFVLYVINILDRTNVGFAKLQMLGDLEMGNAAYGLGTACFTWVMCCSRCLAI